MSALPNPLHTQQKKTPGRAVRPSKLNQYGRDPQSPSERTRDSSDYDTEKGYAPFFHAFLADWPRISSGHVSDMMLNTVLCKSLGRSVRKGEPRPTGTLPFAVEDLARLCGADYGRCDVRSVERELKGWHERKIAHVKKEGKGLVSIELLYRGWEALPNYKAVVDIATGAPVDDETAKEHTRVELTKVPLACKAGGRSKGVKVDCGIKTFHLVNPSVVDFEIMAVVQAGDLGITVKVPDEWLQNAAKRAAASNVSSDLDSPPRHGRPSVPGNIAANVGRKSSPLTASHPRAAELVALFDPILSMAHAGLLSSEANLASLIAACEAVADCDHNFLVKFAIQRAERPVKSPLHIPTICKEALASWKASKVLTGAKLPTSEQEGLRLSPQGKRIAEGLRRIYGDKIK